MKKQEIVASALKDYLGFENTNKTEDFTEEELTSFGEHLFEYGEDEKLEEAIKVLEKLKTKFDFFLEEADDYQVKKTYENYSIATTECIYQLKMLERI
jgi:hypothetical protein